MSNHRYIKIDTAKGTDLEPFGADMLSLTPMILPFAFFLCGHKWTGQKKPQR